MRDFYYIIQPDFFKENFFFSPITIIFRNTLIFEYYDKKKTSKSVIYFLVPDMKGSLDALHCLLRCYCLQIESFSTHAEILLKATAPAAIAKVPAAKRSALK
jgi:hypothetical protein